MESTVIRFLRERDVGQDIINVFIKEKIDAATVLSLDDQTYTRYLPAIGDRVALRKHCEQTSKTSDGKRKNTLLETLRKKMKLRGNQRQEKEISSEDEAAESSSYSRRVNPKITEKNTHIIEIGWMHMSKQVRAINGGGTRKLPVSKNACYSDLLKIGKDLFFPDGMSPKGPEMNFSFTMLDFKQDKMPQDKTVGEMYEKAKMGPKLRFYISTVGIIDCNTDIEEDIFDNDLSNFDNHDEKECSSGLDSDQDESAEDQESGGGLGHEEPGEAAALPDSYISNNDGQFVSVLDNSYVSEATSNMSPSPTQTPVAHIVELLSVTIKVHRVNILEEMVAQFKDPAILQCPLKFCFIDERGADAQGVSRDAYSAFWSEFFDGSAEGEDMRVPSLSPKWKDEEWRAVGRILAKGFKDHGYFPTRLAPAFTEALVYGEYSVSSDQLFESLLLYFSQSERDLVSSALKNELSGDEKEELIDLMDRMGVTRIPTPGNLKRILLQVAHKQLIQKPKYALDYMAEGVGQIFRESFQSPLEFQQIYNEKKPTTRKILKLIDASPTTAAESQSLQFLRQYIRAQDEAGLRRVLRYMTGSDVVCVPKIEILFTPLEGLARRPVAHTCGPVLELPHTYNSYPELRAEMESILANKNSFILDIA